MDNVKPAAGHGGFGLLGQYDLQQTPFIFMPFTGIATARCVLFKKNEFFIFNAFIHLLKTTRFIDSESFIKIENIFFQPPRHRTIVTGVPTLTVLKSGTQEERVMRMHPCDWGVWKTGPTCMPMPLSVSRMK